MSTFADRASVEILIAEDSPTQAQRLQHILKQQGYSITLASNGRQAFEIAQRRKPTLIISDVVMPEMDGYELCRQVKADPVLSDVPVILVTTLSDPQDVIRGLECRADTFILKPYDERYLLGRVQFVLINREMRQNDQPGMGIEIYFDGQKHFITADRLQILNLLLSTYEAAMQRNRELTLAEDTLRGTNSALQELTTELEERVRERTEKLNAQVERLNLLNQITRAIGDRQDLQSIFQAVIRRLEDQLPADFICVCRYDQANRAFVITNVGLRGETLAVDLALTNQGCIDLHQNGLSRCLSGEMVYEPDLARTAFPFPERLLHGGIQSLVAAPIQVEGQVLGILMITRREPNGFSEDERDFLRQLSEHVALATHQAELHRSLKQAYDDLRQTQQIVVQQERLRALGQMASGVAHDINNAISPVALYTESLLEKEPNLSAQGRVQLLTIQRAIGDVAETVARMRELYRERKPQLNLVPVQVNQMMEQVVEMTRARWSDIPLANGIVIDIMTDLITDLPPIMGVESEIREILTNLIFNAVDAMPAGGTLALRTAILQSTPLDIQEFKRVKVEVTDTGVGMDEETQRRCMEPFFTSKGERGTGLGLAIIYGIVERHKGEIEIVSAPGEGTTIKLTFPVAEKGTSMIKAATDVTAVPPLRILVVDDDPLVLGSVCDTLKGDGHSVIAANGGQEGIQTFRNAFEHNEPFAVVITDLGMPFVDGRKVATAVKSISNDTRVIMFTGWGKTLIDNDEVPPHVDFVLSKPPKLHDLRETLARASAGIN